MSLSGLTPFAFVHAGAKSANGESIGTSTMTTRIKTDFLDKSPGARLEFRKTDRINGTNAHIFWILVPNGSEPRYQSMLECIGEDFHQGNGFVVYKWKQRVSETPAPSMEPTRSQAARAGYGKMSSTWGASLSPELAATVIHCPRRTPK